MSGARADRTRLPVRRSRAIAVGFVALGSVYAAWVGFGVQTMGDYPGNFAAPMNALLDGRFSELFAQLPADGAGGSVLLRAPAAGLGKLLLGGQLAIFRFGALACMLALGALGMWLARGMRVMGRPAIERAAVLGLCILSPVLLGAIVFGHPEEPLGAALCVTAVLLAGGGRTKLAGLALGLAAINKPWGVLAAIPVLLAAPNGRRAMLAAAGAIVALWAAVAYAVSPAGFDHAYLAASSAVIAHPVDLWWPFAHLVNPPGVTPAYYPPQLVADHARELVVLLAVPLSLPLARRRANTDEALALLALLFLLRCLLDPSNHVYYQLPFVIALTAWQAHRSEAPVLALLATLAFWLTFHTVAGTGSLDAQYAAYLSIALPLAAYLVRPAFGHAVASGRVLERYTTWRRGYRPAT